MKTLAASAALFVALAPSLPAQVDYTEPGRPYLQTFDLAEGGFAALPWTDNQTFRGWFALFYDGLRATYTVPETILPTSGPGRLDTAFYLYRPEPRASATPLDAALGTQPTDQRAPGVGSGGIFYGVALVNRTNTTLDRLRLSYRVELWRLATTRNKQSTLSASYRVGGQGLAEGAWTLVPGGVYTTPLAAEPDTQARSLDGNAPEHRSPFDLALAGLALAPGQTLWIRWFDVNNSLADHGIGLDDVSITLSP
jgi:hypothetical protein